MPAHENGGYSARLLVVDDDETGRYVKTRLLQKAGWTVDQAVDGQETLRYVASHPVDLIILDVRLPDIPGTDICRRIKRDYAGILVLQTSATFIDSDDRVAALDAGADAYLVEPAEAPELIAVVRALLRAKAAEDKLRAANSLLAKTAEERLQTQEALRESAERLALALRAGKLGVHDYDPRTGLIKWDAAVRSLWGVSGDEPITFAAFAAGVHPDDLPTVQAAMDKALDPDGDGRYEAEFRVISRADGIERWVYADGEATFVDCQPVRLVGTIQDITKRKQNEAALAESEQRLRSFLENSATVAWLKDDEGRHVFISRNFEQRFGVSLKDWMGKTDFEVWPRAVADEFRKNDIAALAADRPIEVIESAPNPDGTTSWWLNNKFTFRDAAGRRYVGALGVDITERHRVEEALRLKTAELESLLTSAPIGIAFFDRQHRYIRINDELAAINGIAAADHIGRTVAEVLPGARAVDSLLDTVFETGQTIPNVEVSGETPRESGVLRHWLAGFYPVRNARGEVETAGVWVTEISERKRAEEHKTLLVHELNHRVKNTLATVQALAMQTFRGARFGEETIQSFLNRLRALASAHDMLTRESWDSADLRDVVAQAISPQDAKRFHIAGPSVRLPPKSALAMAMGLHELCTNAAKYGALSSEQGLVRITWTLSHDAQPPRLRLQWQETGGPKVAKPKRQGFGTRMIERLLTHDLDAQIVVHYRPSGVVCTIDAVLPGRSGNDAQALRVEAAAR